MVDHTASGLIQFLYLGEGLRCAEQRAREQQRDLEASRQSLQDSEAYLRSIVEGSPDCIKLLDLQTNLLSVNKNGLELLEADSSAGPAV